MLRGAGMREGMTLPSRARRRRSINCTSWTSGEVEERMTSVSAASTPSMAVELGVSDMAKLSFLA